jgi:hypothetical protein
MPQFQGGVRASFLRGSALILAHIVLGQLAGCLHDTSELDPPRADLSGADQRIFVDVGRIDLKRKDLAVDQIVDQTVDHPSPDLGCSSPLTFCGSCVNLSTSNAHCGKCDHACEANMSCQNKTCNCKDGYGDCTGGAGCETYLPGNLAHCGGCNRPCPSGHDCAGDTCKCQMGTAGACGGTSMFCDTDGTCKSCPSGKYNCDRMNDCGGTNPC